MLPIVCGRGCGFPVNLSMAAEDAGSVRGIHGRDAGQES